MSGEGERAVAGSGILTFLFTDIEGSTRGCEADAEAMRAALEKHYDAGGMRSALAAHDAVLRDAVETNEGRLFTHTGDGVSHAQARP